MAEEIRRTLGLALMFMLAVPGCGESGPSLVGLTGKVSQTGKPIEGAAVMFMPTPSSKDARPAQDTTEPDGSFRLMTGDRSGIVPGQYMVTIVKALPASTSNDPFMATMAPVDPKTVKRKKKEESVPGQFAFEREVTSQGGTLDFELKESPAQP